MAAQLGKTRSSALAALAGLCLLILTATAQSAHSEGRPAYGQQLVASLLEEPLVVDPIAAQTHTDMTVVSLLFDTLYRVEDGKVVAHLAAALPDESEPLRVTIALRPGVQFHDKTPLRAQDVAASLQRLLESDLGFLLETVKRVEVGTPIVAMGPAPLPTVVLVLRTADPTLARRLTDLHSAIVARGQAPHWRRLVGTGPWQLRERSASKSALVLRAFDSYFAGRSYLDELVLRWHPTADAEARQYEAGAAHISARGQIAFAGHRPKYQTKSFEHDVGVLSYLGFGRASAIAAEPEFRRALSAAVGRLGMSQIGSGETLEPTTTVVAPRRPPRRFSLLANPTMVSGLLAELSKRYPSVEARTLELQLIVNASRPDDAVIAARVAAALFTHGIKSKIVSLGADVFARRSRAGQCDLYIGQLASSGATAADQVRVAFVVGHQSKVAATLKGQTRAAVERRFDSDLPLIPLFRRSLLLHYRSDVYGLEFSDTATLRYPSVFFSGLPVKN